MSDLIFVCLKMNLHLKYFNRTMLYVAWDLALGFRTCVPDSQFEENAELGWGKLQISKYVEV